MARLYKLLLLFYPASLRRDLGAEMAATVDERWRALPSATARARLLVWLLADFFTSLPREWRTALGRPPRGHRPGRASKFSVFSNLRSATRLMIRQPWFTIGAVATLGLGIGATSAIVSLADATLLRPLPIADASRVYQSDWSWSPPDFRDLEATATSLTDVSAFANLTAGLDLTGESLAVPAQAVSGRFFALTGLAPVSGRLLAPADDAPGAPAVAVLGERLWQRWFDRDPELVGRTVTINQRPVTVVGIVPAAFRGLSLRDRPEIYLPIRSLVVVGTGFQARPTTMTSRDFVWLQVVGRLAPGATVDAAAAEVQAIYQRNRPANPTRIEEPVVLVPVVARAIGADGSTDLRRFIVLLSGATAAVLLLACATVANMLLVRINVRRRELAVRAALGGGRGHLVRLVLTESLLIGLSGAVAGVVIARATLAALGVFVLPGDIAIADLTLRVNPTMLGVAVAAGLLTTLVSGSAPTWRAARVDPRAALGEGARGSARRPFVALLVAVQVASCVVLLAGGLAFGRALHHALTIDLGFDVEHTAIVSVNPALGRLTDDRTRVFQRTALDEARRQPAIAAAAWSVMQPLRGMMQWELAVPGDTRPRSADIAERSVESNIVSDGYFETMGIALRRGRDFRRGDRVGAPRVAILSESLAAKYFAGADPIGRQVSLDPSFQDPDAQRTIVGVVADIQRGVTRERSGMLYLPLFQQESTLGSGASNLLVRSQTTAVSAAAAAATSTIRAVEPGVPVIGAETLADHLSGTLMSHRLGLALFAMFASLAVVLTVLGLYAVVAYAVTARTREISIRLALGAPRASVLALTVRHGLWPVVAGVAAGAVGVVQAAGTIRSFMFSLPPVDGWSVAALGLGIACLALLSMLVPARRAMAVEPADALRES